MNRFKTVSVALVATAIAPALTSCTAAEKKQPNLLYIFPDQYRLHALSLWSDPEYQEALGSMGDNVKTPNLDKLARQGVVFTQASTTYPISSPHRAMMMSGMFPSQNGVDGNCHGGRKWGLHHEIESFTDVLANNGYETAYVGKTHWEMTEPLFDKEGNYVGTEDAPGGHYANIFDTYIPEGRGRFGNKFWFQHIRDDHKNAYAYSNIAELVDGKSDGEVYKSHTFTPTYEADIVIDYIKNEKSQRDASKPFSMIWSINPPHSPYYNVDDCQESIYYEYYDDVEWTDLLDRPNVDDAGFIEKAKSRGQYRGYSPATNVKIYFSLITGVDREIGRVLDALEASGEAENTVIVFTSDHGELMGSHAMCGKGPIYDESYLVPFIVRYPAVIKERRVDDLIFGSTDIMPTILGVMGLGDKIPAAVAGRDFSKGFITGEYDQKPISSPYLTPGSKGVRTDTYSYLVNKDGSYELYNNHDDPYQMKSLKLEEIAPDQAALLKSETGRWIIKAQDSWAAKRVNSGLITYPEI